MLLRNVSQAYQAMDLVKRWTLRKIRRSKVYFFMLKLSRKLNKREKEEYVSICETVYGCIPVDVEWATSTEVYKAEKNKRFSGSEAKFSLTVSGLAKKPN